MKPNGCRYISSILPIAHIADGPQPAYIRLEGKNTWDKINVVAYNPQTGVIETPHALHFPSENSNVNNVERRVSETL